MKPLPRRQRHTPAGQKRQIRRCRDHLPNSVVAAAASCRKRKVKKCVLPCATRIFVLLTPEPANSAAESGDQPAQAHRPQRRAAPGIAPIRARLLPVECAAVFHGGEGVQIDPVGRFHGYRPADMLQSGHLIAQPMVSKGRKIIPPGVALLVLL